MQAALERAGLQQAAPASVRVAFNNLPPESRLKLDEALQSWAAWHADRYLPGYVPQEVVSGKLAYTPGEVVQLVERADSDMEDDSGGGVAGGTAGAAFIWEDKPAAPEKSGADTLWFNITYERVGDVPRYDRATDGLLHHAGRAKRPASEGLLAAEEAQGVGRPVKRLRGSNRCFNCGSYGHSLRECFKEHNKELVEESRREQAEAREASGAAYRSGARRYYLPGADEAGGGGGGKGPEREAGEFAGLEPGKLSDDLRAALGIGPLAPPPWLHRMRELGLPPGYMAAAPAPPDSPGKHVRQDGAPGAAAAAETAASADAAEQPGTANGHAAAAAEQVCTDDFIPLEGSLPPQQGVPPGLDDFIPLADSPQQQQQQPAVAAGGGEDGGTAVQLECQVQFPGVNAPLPEGADERDWERPAQQPAAAPPGFGTPQSAGPRQRQLGGSAGRSAGRSGSGGLARLSGLHPRRGATQQDGRGDSPIRRHSAPGPAPHHPLPMHHAGSTPDLHRPPQQTAPAAAPQLPPGFGHQPPLPPPQQQPHQEAQQWQHQQPAAGPAPAPLDVYSVSRIDPGHMLVFDQGRAGMAPPQQHPHYAPQLLLQQAQQAQGWGWGGAAPQQVYQPQQQQQQQQQYLQPQYLQQPYQQQYHQQQHQPSGAWPGQQPAPLHPQYSPLSGVGAAAGNGAPQGGWQQDAEEEQERRREADRRRQEYEARLWQSSGR